MVMHSHRRQTRSRQGYIYQLAVHMTLACGFSPHTRIPPQNLRPAQGLGQMMHPTVHGDGGSIRLPE